MKGYCNRCEKYGNLYQYSFNPIDDSTIYNRQVYLCPKCQNVWVSIISSQGFYTNYKGDNLEQEKIISVLYNRLFRYWFMSTAKKHIISDEELIAKLL